MGRFGHRVRQTLPTMPALNTIRRACVLALVTTAIGCGCDGDFHESYASPSGKQKAVVYDFDCGATTQTSVRITIADSADKFDPNSGYFFQATTNHGKAPFGQKGGPQVAIVWASDDLLIVTYDHRADIFEQKANFRGVQISYRRL